MGMASIGAALPRGPVLRGLGAQPLVTRQVRPKHHGACLRGGRVGPGHPIAAAVPASGAAAMGKVASIFGRSWRC